MKYRSAVCCLLSSLSALSAAASVDVCELASDFWDKPRSMNRILSAGIKPCAETLLKENNLGGLIVYPARDAEGALHAEELRDWLMASGLDTRRLELRADGGKGMSYRLEIKKP